AYEIGAHLPEILEGLLVAYVDHRIEHSALNALAETIMLNRGGKGKIFMDVDEAKKWLLSMDEPKGEQKEEQVEKSL
ncbi:MAG: hypothetical protein ACK419_03100, partial [Pyrinomonadaceae bacterium]